MTTYTFTFPVEAAGLWVRVLDFLGNPVATAVVFSNGSNAVASFDLPTGTYIAQLAGIDGEQSMVRPDDDNATGGSGVELHGESYYFERNANQVISGGFNAPIIFDTVYGPGDGGYTDYEDDMTQLALPVGVYLADFFVDIDTPTTDRLLSAQLFSNGGVGAPSMSVSGGQTFVPETAASGSVSGSGVVVVPLVDPSIYMVLNVGAKEADALVDPSNDITVSYVSLFLRRIA